MNVFVLLSHIVSGLLFPPVSLGLLCLAGLLLRRRWPRAAYALSASALLLLLALSTNTGSCLLVAPLENRTPPLSVPAKTDAQAIVVLGGGRISHAPEYEGADSPNGIDLARLRYAARLQRITGLPLLVSGGKPDGAAESEAKIMARSLREDFRVPVQWLEEASNTTAENAAYSARLLKGAGISRILLVTDAMHMVRSRASFEKAGLAVIAAPTVFFSAERRTALDFVPNGEALRRSHYALHEWIGLLWYRLKSGISGADHSGPGAHVSSSATAP